MSPMARRFGRVLIVALVSLMPAIAFAGPAEDAGLVINHWAEAFNANHVDSLVDLYAPDTILVGTAGSSLFEGKDAVHNYFRQVGKERGHSFGRHLRGHRAS
jgi:ketosteroid isomerase-like protein